jgi:hypothetical protein
MPAKADDVIRQLSAVTDLTDELAGAFYELNASSIDKFMTDLFTQGIAATDGISVDWEGKDDAFTTWVVKFRANIQLS